MVFWLAVILVLGLSLVLAAFQKNWPRLRQIAQGLLISYGTILIILLLGEAYFRFVHAKSTAFFSLSQLNWLNRYWQQNSDEYRDREWHTEDFVGRTVITVIGDSFTAGSGINDPSDRYTNQLAALLGADYALVNLGIPGTSTPSQLEALQSFDLAQPNIVIWQYFLNDIEYAALRVSVVPPVLEPPAIARESYLLNFLYFQLSPPAVDYWGWLYNKYDNSVIWDLHRQEIEALVNYVDSQDAELIVLIYPNMLDPVGSIPYVDRLAQAIEATNHHNILKLYDAVAAWPHGTPLIVSSHDAHPSIAFNHYVAETLYQSYFADNAE